MAVTELLLLICVGLSVRIHRNRVCLPLQAGKVRKHVSEQEKAEEGLGPNIKSIVTMLMLMLLMMFAVHCTWVTSNAYSSPSVVLASYNNDGYDDFYTRRTHASVGMCERLLNNNKESSTDQVPVKVYNAADLHVN